MPLSWDEGTWSFVDIDIHSIDGNMKDGGDAHDILWDSHDNVRSTNIYCDFNKFDCEIASYHYR